MVIKFAFLKSSGLAQTWQDSIGYTRLRSELGTTLPQGTGVSVTQVEANEVSGTLSFQPTLNANPTSGNYAGKNFVFVPAANGAVVSSHAVRVANFFYGLNTSVANGDASVAPQIGQGLGEQCRVVASDSFLNGLQSGVALPQLEINDIVNHSWLGVDGTNDKLQRLDYSVERDDFVAVVGINNGLSTSVPIYMATAYNVLTVGRADGEHSRGVTSSAFDGRGRVRPDLVTPLDRTSWGAALVSSCAAFLHSHAESQTVLANGLKNEVIRAILLTGANKAPFSNWSNTRTRPLDSVYGAGQVQLYQSYKILDAGETGPSATTAMTVVPNQGWDYVSSLAANGQNNYRLRVPAGSKAKLTATLVWNRRIGLNGTLWTNPTPQLANLDLLLLNTSNASEVSASASGSAGSAAHTTEHIYVRELSPGDYWLRVTSASGSPTVDYGLAWQMAITADNPPTLSINNGSVLQARNLIIGLSYQVQASTDLINWTSVENFIADATTRNLVTALSLAGNPRRFYRLAWSSP